MAAGARCPAQRYVRLASEHLPQYANRVTLGGPLTAQFRHSDRSPGKADAAANSGNLAERERDSNPRDGYPPNRFRVCRNRPLCHLSAAGGVLSGPTRRASVPGRGDALDHHVDAGGLAGGRAAQGRDRRRRRTAPSDARRSRQIARSRLHIRVRAGMASPCEPCRGTR